jgi:hypothetical protein
MSRFQALCAIAIAAGPRLRAVLIAAFAPVMRILNSRELEIFLPIRTFFL